MLQQLYLPKCSLGQDLLTEDIGNLLDGNPLTSLVVRSSAANGLSSELASSIVYLSLHTRLCHKRLDPALW
jgi:hypothetical protein